MATNNLTSVTGVVENVNDKGFKLDNGNWFNYSDYGYKGPKGGLPAAQVGQRVALQIKNDRFVQTFNVLEAGVALPTPTVPNAVAVKQAEDAVVLAGTRAMVASDLQKAQLIATTIETRQTLLKTLALAQPAMFNLDTLDTLTELVRNLEQFVLEDLIAQHAPEAEPDADDLLDEDGDI